MNKSLLTTALLAGLSLTAHADNLEGFYVGGGATRVETNFSTPTGGSTSVNAVEFLGGYKYSPYIGGEVRVGTGVSESSTVSGTGVPIELSLSHFESVYYRMESANQTAKSYILLGFANVEIEGEDGAGNSESLSESGLSYGAGIGFVLNEFSNLNFEYRVLVDTDDLEFTSMSVNYDFRF